MSDAADNLAIARRYLKAIETGASGDEIATFFAPEAVVEILPSLYFPHGSRSNLDEVRAGAERGKKVMSSQQYEVKNELANGDRWSWKWIGPERWLCPFKIFQWAE